MPTFVQPHYVNTHIQIASYRNAFEDGLLEQKQCFEKDQKRFAVYPREDYYLGNVEVKKTSSGEERWASFERLINGGLGWKLHVFQATFMVMIKESLAPYIHGTSWDSVKEGFLKKRGYSESPSRVCVASGPRRIGKSAVQALTMLSTALSVPGSKQGCFSTGMRSSKNMLNYANTILIEAGYEDWVISKNQEELILADPQNKYSVRNMSFFPSSTDVSAQKNTTHS